MDKFKFHCSVFLAKAAYTILKITKLSSGTSIIGKLVLDINPNFLSECNPYIKTKINVTGTNGKTTTSGLITHLIKESNHSVINNSLGANMLTGVVNTIATTLNPKAGADYAVIESDEAYLQKIYDKFEGDYLVVTNLFRDQLDRYGEISITKKYIQNGIDKRKNLTLILNADDPLVSKFESKNKVFYGFDNVYYADETLKPKVNIEETYDCECGNILEYEKKFFAQQGHYKCSCGHMRPEPKYNADVTIYKDHSVIQLEGESFNIPLVGIFNAYNALAAISLCKEIGIKNIKEHLNSFKVAFGRSEIKYLNDKKTIIQLIKNPIGANEVLKTVDPQSNILIAINDNYADGRDMSWLWDVDFETIMSDKEIVVTGMRANDIALRLKYAEINNVKIISDIKTAIEYISQKADNNITILTSYTALLRINKLKMLKK